MALRKKKKKKKDMALRNKIKNQLDLFDEKD